MRISQVCFAVVTGLAVSSFTVSASEVQTDEEKIETITVYGTKQDKSLTELTGSSAIITDTDIQRYLYTQFSDLFRTEPGVAITGHSGRPQNISIRGMSGNRVLVIQDGTRAADGYGANDINDLVGRFNFDLEDVKSIEVAKGPASTFFGSGALAGVVRVNTKQASDYLTNEQHYLSTKALYSGVNKEFKQTVTGATKIVELPFALKFSNWEGEEQQNYNKTRVPLTIEGQSARLNTQWGTQYGELSINLDWLKQKTRNKYKKTSVPQPDGAWLVDSQQQLETRSNWSYTLGWESNKASWAYDDFSVKGFYRTTEHNNQNHQQLKRTVLEVQDRYRQIYSDDLFEQTSFGANADFGNVLGEHALFYGFSIERLEHRRPKIDTTTENGVTQTKVTHPFNSATTDIFGAYISDEIIINDNWDILFGVRYDQNELAANDGKAGSHSSNHITTSANLNYESDNGLRIYFAYAQGYRAAPYDKVYGNIPHWFAIPPFEIVANPDLNAETSDSLELGFSWQWNDDLQISASSYYTRYDDFIDWIQHPEPNANGAFERQFINIDQAYTYGAELEVNYDVSADLNISLSSGWMDGENKTNQAPLRNLTPFEYALMVNYQWNELVLNTRLYGQSAMDRVPTCDNPQAGTRNLCRQTESWIVLDFNLEYPLLPGLLVNVAANNVLDKEYTRYQDVAGTDISSIDSSQPGRNFSLSLRYTF